MPDNFTSAYIVFVSYPDTGSLEEESGRLVFDETLIDPNIVTRIEYLSARVRRIEHCDQARDWRDGDIHESGSQSTMIFLDLRKTRSWNGGS